MILARVTSPGPGRVRRPGSTLILTQISSRVSHESRAYGPAGAAGAARADDRDGQRHGDGAGASPSRDPAGAGVQPECGLSGPDGHLNCIYPPLGPGGLGGRGGGRSGADSRSR